ncbi:MAG: 2-oxoglutarate dehydrogenase complex dihydrolipoyllysine-residue succinyltransferase [Chlamydiae bacterium]|nr:2-oxoglutarate dehydrogenase complex dihydrolipoyllysine-residue succinyltransferase [Chlamydiota bacterium]
MKVEIKIPPLGESISEAVVSRIIAPNGSMVAEAQEILELETDKVNQVLYAPAKGQIMLTVAVDQTVAVGQVIGSVDTDAKGAPAEPAAVEPAPKVAAIEKSAPAVKAPEPVAKITEGPSSRMMVSEFVSEIKTPKAVALPSQSPAAILVAPGTTRKKMSGLRRTIAQRLVEVKNTTAMLTTFNEVDMSAVMEIRSREKDAFFTKHGVKLGFMSFFVKAAAAALKAYPEVNAYIDGDEIVTFSTYNIGVAVSTDRGLVVPVIRGCDSLSFGGVEKEIDRYAKKARDGSIGIDDMRGGTFTITNGGVFGSLLSTPILNPPQSAILGMHSIVKRAMVVDDEIVIRPMMYLALSYDHRIIDGKQAVLFLVTMKQNLEDPAKMLLDL